LATAVVSARDDKPAETGKPDAKSKKDEELPLKPDRTIEFTTNEGTWVSLDVSPDGKTILFELLGDLFTIPIEGGEAKAITTGLPFDSQPHYSPDGKKIVYVSDRDGSDNVWIANPDGSEAKALTKDKHALFASPVWTPDGDFVIVAKQSQLPWGVFELWMYHIRGGSGVQITKGRPKPDAPPDQWSHGIGGVASPDGKYIYYAKRNKYFNAYNVTYPLSQIVRRDRVTGDEDTITDAQGSGVRPLLSPDGTLLVYGTRVDNETGLRIRNLSTGEEHWLKRPVQRDDQESRFTRDFLPGYAFTPDGKEVVVAYAGKIHRIKVEDGVDRVVPMTVKVSQRVGSRLNFPIRVDDGPVRARLVQDPEFSPDGKRLAFSALTRLYVMDAPSGKPVRLEDKDAREFHPTWSPDGKWLAYVTWAPGGGQIWKRLADGTGKPQQLTREAAFYRDPVFSPDGSRIVALRAPSQERLESPVDFGSSPGLDLIWIPSEGGDAKLINPARGSSHPHFTKENDRIYITTGGGLVSMRFDGTDRQTHIKVVGKASRPFGQNNADDILLSPDGRWALALVSNQLYLVVVPRIGGETPTVDVFGSVVPIKKLTDVGADWMSWTDGGATITWALGASCFRQPLASVNFDEPKKSESDDKKADDDKAKKDDKKSAAEEIAIVIEQPRHQPRGTVVLRGAHVVTMRGDEVISDADVVVKDNRISAVGARDKVHAPEDVKVIDVAGMTIVPGFVDTHAHWTEIRRGVLDLQNWSFFANLAFGVTTGRDPQTMTNDMFAYQDLVDTGDLVGPRAYSTGPGVFSDTDFQSADEVDSVVAKYKKYYRTNTLKSYMIGNRKQRQWMVMACRKHEVMPTTEGGLDLKLNLTHVLDGFSGNEHALPIVPLSNDVVELVARSGISYTPTLLVAYGGPFGETYFFTTTDIHDDPKVRRFIPHAVLDAKVRRSPWFHKDEHIFPKIAESAAKVIRAGGHVCIGSHGEMQGIGYHWEMWALASGGLTPLEVLRAATLHGAEAIGYSQDLGSIESGKLADFVVLSKDPLKDIHNTTAIRYVMKNGELFEGDTLDQIWPEPKKLPPLWWWNAK
jgi:Tol biopolymer transport system component